MFENLIDQGKGLFNSNPQFLVYPGLMRAWKLTPSNAFCHKGCYDNFIDSHYESLIKRVQKQSSEGSPYSTQTIPHKQRKKKETEIGKAVCLFCKN